VRFYLVDKITEFKKGVSIKGWKNVSMTEPFFTFHFPRHPVMPGVLIIESMAQLAGLLVEMSFPKDGYKKAFLSIVDKTKFRFMVRPGDRLELEAKLENHSEHGASCSVSVSVDGKPLADTMLTFALQNVADQYDEYLEGERLALIDTLMRDVVRDDE
jgi:3-hydroxyacyl-[acyl-carrier-protein] dehydratase